MPITPERVSILRSYGLSEYGARAYLALLDLGTTEARDVSRLARVPIGKIYQTLDQLHERGLIEVMPETPKKYAPLPFSAYLERVRAGHEAAILGIDRSRAAIDLQFPIVGQTEIGDRGGFNLLRGRTNVLERIRRLARGAHVSLLACETPGFVRRHAAVLGPGAEPRVRPRLLLPTHEAVLAVEEALGSAVDLRIAARRADGPGGNVAIWIADGQQAVIAHYIPDDGSRTGGKDVGILVDEDAMVKALAATLEGHWEASASERAVRTPAPPLQSFS